MSAWSGGRVLLLETNVEVQAHRPPLRKSSESESGPVLNEITGSDPVIYPTLSDPVIHPIHPVILSQLSQRACASSKCPSLASRR